MKTLTLIDNLIKGGDTNGTIINYNTGFLIESFEPNLLSTTKTVIA